MVSNPTTATACSRLRLPPRAIPIPKKAFFSPTLEPNSKTAILVATSEFSIALNSHLSAPVQVPAKLGRNCPISQPGEKTDERKTHLLERETDNLNRPLDHVDGT